MDSQHLGFDSQNIDYTKNPELFFKRCQNELNHHAARKKSIYIGIINLSKLKSIMKRTHFRNDILKNLTDKNRLNYMRQRKSYVSLPRKEKNNVLQN